jgi:esterase/lipase
MKRPLKILAGLGLFLMIFVATVLGLTEYYPMNEKLANWQAPEMAENLDTYLQSTETIFHPKLGTEKMILWARPDKRKTSLAFVYLHGFSASRREISPVLEGIAEKLHANVYFARLRGSGVGLAGFNLATAEDWIADANEALAIGKRIGEKVILVGTSTGGSLAIHLAARQDPALAGMILISPNFRPYRTESFLSGGPLGGVLTRWALGEGYAWKARNPEQAYYWTTTYPPGAVHELMELLKHVNRIPLAEIHVPSLWLYTKYDHVVDTSLIVSKFQELGSEKKKLIETGFKNHVLAGTIVNPEGTERVQAEILEFLAR